MAAEVKVGEERQAKAQAAYNAVLAKGGENASINANKVYAEMLVAKEEAVESIPDFEMSAEIEADQLKEVEPADKPKIAEAEKQTKAKK
jgi:hypothetical protein